MSLNFIILTVEQKLVFFVFFNISVKIIVVKTKNSVKEKSADWGLGTLSKIWIICINNMADFSNLLCYTPLNRICL